MYCMSVIATSDHFESVSNKSNQIKFYLKSVLFILQLLIKDSLVVAPNV